jgi:arsenate reductase
MVRQAAAGGTMSDGMLVLCVGSAVCSQMAEGLARARFGPARLTATAGSKPSTLNPFAVAAMAESGIDIADHRSEGLEDVDLSRFGTIVALCAEEVRSFVVGATLRLHWTIPGPAQVGTTDAFRAGRDEIGCRLRDLALAASDPP